MPLSANTLIHFSDKKTTLKKILEEGFRVFNCKEEVIFGSSPLIYHAPMVSFCDIPLSEVKDHVSKYGCYDLGLTKEWGVSRGLNPVLYFSKGSELSKSYKNAFNHFLTEDDDDIDTWNDEQKSLADVMRYIKNYEADLTRKGNIIHNYRFSDEREWRYVPPLSEKFDMITGGNWYSVPENKTESDGKLVNLRLDFGPNDIKYIIINDDSEIGEFINHIREANAKRYTLDDIERLTTRILTVEQINTDV